MTADRADDRELSIVRLINIVLRYRSTVVRWAVGLFILVVTVTLILPRTYTARVSFTPQADRLSSSLAGVAAQFGVSLPNTDVAASPDFYVELLGTDRLLGEALETTYRFRSDTGEVGAKLVDILKIEGDTREERLDKGILKFRKMLNTESDAATGVVRVDVETDNPELSAEIADRLIALVNKFNRETRQSQASAERQFAEGRLADSKKQLREAENQLQRFLELNREVSNSPVLTFQQDRLNREVTIRENVVNALAQAYEQARIDEVRDLPVITVVENPRMPGLPDPRRLLLRGVLALFAGALVGAFIALWRAFIRSTRDDPAEELTEFRALKTETAGDVRRGWSRMARILHRD